MENIIRDLRDAEYAIWDFSVSIMSIYIEMLTCNSGLYCLYLFIFYTWIFVYLLISFI